MTFLAEWPWASRLIWTVATIGVAYGIGYLLKTIVGGRLARAIARTTWRWDDALLAGVGHLPFWCALGGAYASLRHWSLSPDDHGYAVQVLSVLGVASVTFALAAVATRLVSLYGPRATPGAPVSALAENVVRAVVVFLGALVIIRSFEYDITPYLAALGVGGLAVALALQDPLSNFFAGIFTSVSGQIRIGDFVRLDGGTEGYVADFNWRATSIRQLSGNLVIVPNAKLAQATVTNFHQPSRDLAINVDVGVHYLSDLTTVERVTADVARDVMKHVPGAASDFEPFVRFHTFGPTSVLCSVTMRVQEFTDQYLVKHEFVKRLHARYSLEGIAVPFLPLDLQARLPVAESE